VSARALLEARGFEVRVARRSSGRPAGEVLEQSPVAGRTLQPGGMVTLTIARAVAPVVVRMDVPDVVSLPVAEATASLRRAGLRAQVELVSSSGAAGTVVKQTPAAGSEVEEGTLVSLAIARSQSPPVTRVEVPDVVGSTVDEARQTLRALGLRVSVRTVLAQTPAGTVVGQTPSANSTVREGSSVRLRVSTGPRSVTVPDVLGLDEITARAELEAAGFVVRVSEEPTDDPANDGVVLAQSPSGGSSSDEGTVVTLVLGRFD
jgi:beta-lactam-binding protein with PASTA domain